MATFPGDMNIGWGFGLEPQQEYSYDGYTWFDVRDESVPSLAKHVRDKTSPNWDDEHSGEQEEPQLTDPLLAVSELEQRVNDLEERLRSLCVVVNSLVEVTEEKEGETN